MRESNTLTNKLIHPSSISNIPHPKTVSGHEEQQNYHNQKNSGTSEVAWKVEETFTVVKRRHRKQKLMSSNVEEKDLSEVVIEGREENNPEKNTKLIRLFLLRSKEHVTEEIVKKYIHKRNQVI